MWYGFKYILKGKTITNNIRSSGFKNSHKINEYDHCCYINISNYSGQ